MSAGLRQLNDRIEFLRARVHTLEVEMEEVIKELRSLPILLNQLIDSVVLASNPGQFVRDKLSKWPGDHHDGSAQTTEEEAAVNRAEGEGMIQAKFPPEYK